MAAGSAEPRLELPAVARLAADFESGDLDPASFHHREHMLVALWLIAHDSRERALDRMRRGLHGLLARVGRDAYHETVTVFWMRVLAHRLACTDATQPLDRRLEEVVAWCSASQPLARHYSDARLSDPAGRRRFMAPDLLPMPDDEVGV